VAPLAPPLGDVALQFLFLHSTRHGYHLVVRSLNGRIENTKKKKKKKKRNNDVAAIRCYLESLSVRVVPQGRHPSTCRILQHRQQLRACRDHGLMARALAQVDGDAVSQADVERHADLFQLLVGLRIWSIGKDY
jgi:hypothetical protein